MKLPSKTINTIDVNTSKVEKVINKEAPSGRASPNIAASASKTAKKLPQKKNVIEDNKARQE